MKDSLTSFINLARRKKMLMVFVEDFMFGTTVLISSFVCLCILNQVLASLLPFWLFCLILIAVCTNMVLRLFFTIFLKPEKIISEIQLKNTFLRDNLINAWQLSKDLSNGNISKYGISNEITKKFIENVSSTLSNRLINDTYSLNSVLSRFGILFILSILLFLYFLKIPYHIPLDLLRPTLKIERFIEISPGDISIPLGGSVKFHVEPIGDYLYTPVLVMRVGEGKYKKIDMYPVGRAFEYEVMNVTEDITYYIKWGGLRSRRFKVSVMAPVSILDLDVTVIPPSYTKKPVERYKRLDALSYLPGTILKFSGTCDKDLKTAFLIDADGNSKKLSVEKNKFHGELKIKGENAYHFDILAYDGTKNIPVKYSVTTIDDEPPKVCILSPICDLVVSEYDVISILYSAEDDFGISQLSLKLRGKYLGTKKEIQLTIPKKPTDVCEYKLDILKLGIPSGELIEYFITALDNDIVTGPKRTDSKSYYIEIYGYKQERIEIEEKLKEVRNDLLDALAQQIKCHQDVSNILKSTPPYSSVDINRIMDQQNRIDELMKKMIEKLSRSLDKMEKNPLFDYFTLYQHQSLLDDMRYIQSDKTAQAVESIKKQELSKTSQLQDEIIKALERMATTSESLYKYQKMRDTLEASARALKLTDELESTLGDDKITEEDMKKISRLFEEINKELAEIQNLLEKMPKELPEDFINQPAVKQINLQEVSDIMNALNKSLAGGDFETALKYARQLRDKLRSLRNMLHEAFKSMGLESNLAGVISEMKKCLDEINKIIDRQSNLLDKTNVFELKMKEKMLRKQEEIFESLAAMQKKAIDVFKSVTAKIKETKLYSTATRILSQMNSVYDELIMKKVQDSPKILKEIIPELKSVEASIEDAMKNDVMDVRVIEEKVLDLLTRPQVELSELEKEDLDSMSDEQIKIKDKTDAVNMALRSMSKIPLSGLNMQFNLYNASIEMEKSANNLSLGETNLSMKRQQTALDYLMDARNNMSSGLQGLQKSASLKPGTSSVPSIQGRSGMYGVRIGFVKLPDKTEFIPSHELKSEIMKSLKEKYPKIYKEVIKEYFEKIIK